MEFPKRERAFPQGSPRRSPKATRPGAAATGADENASPNRLVPVMAASPQRKKVLGERNDGGIGGAAPPPPVQQPKPAPSPGPPTLAGRGAGPYDPKTNYTTPRPAFLRYDPEGRREILLRVSRAAEEFHDDCSSTTSGSAASEEDGGSSLSPHAAVESPVSSDSEAEVDDGEEEDEAVPARRGRWARRLFLLLICASCCFCYMYCANPSSFPTYSSEESEDALDLDTEIGGMYHAYDHELDSLRLLATVYMMGPEEDAPGENTTQLVHGDSKSVDHLYDENRASPRARNLVAVTLMGLADICLNVSLGELTCQVWSERSENVPDLREDSDMDKFDTEVAASFHNDKQISEVDCLGGNVPLDSIGSTATHIHDMEEGSSESVHLEGWDDYSNQCELQLLKSMWPAMEPHLLWILACLSFAGLVTALYRCYQRSRDRCTYVTTYETLAEESLSVPHQVVKLSVTSSAQDAQLPAHSSEQPVQLTIPNQGMPDNLGVPMPLTVPKLGPLVSLEDPVQESLPKTDPQESLPKSDPLVTLKVPMIGHGIHGQNLKQGNPENMKTSNGRFLNHSNADSSKQPVVELLGEFTFENSSRGRSVKRLNQNAGDATVQELLEHLGKDQDVDKLQVHSSIIQSPIIRRTKEEQEKSVRGKKTDATPAPLTPTSLRRSSRLRNKVTTP